MTQASSVSSSLSSNFFNSGSLIGSTEYRQSSSCWRRLLVNCFDSVLFGGGLTMTAAQLYHTDATTALLHLCVQSAQKQLTSQIRYKSCCKVTGTGRQEAVSHSTQFCSRIQIYFLELHVYFGPVINIKK